MKVDFYAPCTITGYNDRLGTKPKCNETLGTILDVIESQLHVDFCEDLAEFIENDKFDKLGYKIYATCANMTIYEGKLYIRMSLFINIPQRYESITGPEGQEIKIPYDDYKDFKEFIDTCIGELNGQLMDGWGECFEQHKFTIPDTDAEYYYPKPDCVEFVRWGGVAVGKRNKLMRPIVYIPGDSKVFDHGWVPAGMDDLNIFISQVNGYAVSYYWLCHPIVKQTQNEKTRITKEITKDFMKKYGIDKVFMNSFINWYINMRKNGMCQFSSEEEHRLRAYKTLFE